MVLTLGEIAPGVTIALRSAVSLAWADDGDNGATNAASMRTGLMMAIALAIALFAVVPAVAIPGIERDLQTRAAAALRAHDQGWVTVAGEGLVLQMAGEAPTAAAQEQALQIMASIDGVQAVDDQSTVAPRRHYTLEAVRTQDTMTLSGTVPDQESLDAVLAAIAAVEPSLAVESTIEIVPGEAEAGWREAAAAVGSGAAQLFDGTVRLSDDGIAIAGLVLDPASTEALQATLQGSTIPLAVDVTVVEPRLYGLHLSRTAGRLVLAGQVPSTATRSSLIALAERQGAPRVDAEALVVDPGVATDDWHRLASALIRHVGTMQEAQARLEPGMLTLSGIVADPAMADLTRTALASVFGDQDGMTLAIDIRTAGDSSQGEHGEVRTFQDSAALLAWADSEALPDISDFPTLGPNDCQAALNDLVANERIGFLGDGAEFDPAGWTLLEAVAMTIRRCPDAQIEISGHTDASEDPAASEAVSAARAAAVVDYLTRRGVDPARLVAAGYGDLVPVADNATEEGRERNRRIEFLVVPSP